MTSRRLPAVLVAAGAAGAVASGWASLASSVPHALFPVGLAALWWLAGVVAVRARPDHLSARLLITVGTCHLTAFATASILGVTGGGASWPVWVVAVCANVVYATGFAALALLLAVFPDERLRGRTGWTMALIGVASAVVVPVVAAVTSPRVDLALHAQRSWVAAPSPLPLGGRQVDASAVVPLLVLIGLAILVGRALRARGEQRRQLMWPLTVAAVLALMLVVTPVGTHLLGQGWALVFVPVVGVLPFALLAGLRRYRLLQVELYAGRTLAYGAVLALVLGGYAVAAGLVGRSGALPAVVVAGVAAVTGHPLRVAVEGRVDRFLTGGRVRGHALVRHLVESLESSDAHALATRTADTIVTGMDVSWSEIRCEPGVHVRSGADLCGEPQLVVPLVAAGEEIGEIACGPRRGGWSDDDVHLLAVLGRHAALALRGADLATALARRVDELAASRERLVRAEDEARRRIERDLHDGIQQQLVVLLARLELLRSTLDADSPQGQVAAQSHAQAQRSLADLRNLVRGIHPPLLGDRGLVAAIEAQADQLPIPVTVDVDPRLENLRFPPPVETAAYYVVCEATTNVLKHSEAAHARVVVTPVGQAGLQVAITDEGVGFATTSGSCGLAGLRDRVEALGGRLDIASTIGVGTTVVARFPLLELADAATA